MIYPALYLLPPGTEPYFHPPKDHIYREKPKLGAYHLTPDNLSFFHRFALTQHSQLDNNSLGSNDLLSTTNAITMSAGTTNFEIASFDRGHGNVSQRVCLRTMLQVTNGGEKYRQFYFTLSAHELYTLLDSGASDGSFPWTELLSNLLHRESDRAYLHVQQRLMTTSVALACREEALYADQWDTEVATDVGELMAVRLKCQASDGSWVPLSDCRLKYEIKAARDHIINTISFCPADTVLCSRTSASVGCWRGLSSIRNARSAVKRSCIHQVGSKPNASVSEKPGRSGVERRKSMSSVWTTLWSCPISPVL